MPDNKEVCIAKAKKMLQGMKEKIIEMQGIKPGSNAMGTIEELNRLITESEASLAEDGTSKQ